MVQQSSDNNISSSLLKNKNKILWNNTNHEFNSLTIKRANWNDENHQEPNSESQRRTSECQEMHSILEATIDRQWVIVGYKLIQIKKMNFSSSCTKTCANGSTHQ